MPPKSNQKASTTAKLASTISDLTAALTLVIKRPLKGLRSEVRHGRQRIGKQYKRKSFKLLAGACDMRSCKSAKSTSEGVLRFGGCHGQSWLLCFQMLAKILLAPLELWATIFQKKKFPRLLLFVMVPSCCLLVGWAGYSWLSLRGQQAIGSLRTQASVAVEQNNFAEANVFFEQLEAAKATLSHEEKFRWAQALAQSDHSQRANELLRELAPGLGHTRGYAPAHQFAASSLVRTQKQPYSIEVKRLLKWHLDAGGEPESPEVSFALAQYLISVDQYPRAIEAMAVAAAVKPELYFILARLHQQVGDAEGEQAALSIAQEEFESQLEDDPETHQARIVLAQIYLRQRKLDLAEQQLRAGVELAPEVFRPQLSLFFMQKFHSLPATVDVETKIDSLVNVWRNDLQNVAAFQEAIRLYRQQDARGQQLVLEALQQAVVEQPSAAMPYFALGIIHRLANRLDESKAAIETAYQHLNPNQPGFTAVANNLAWLLAHDQEPDLEQAFKLADMAVRKNPNEGGLRDTLATVLMKQGQYKQALAEFQIALPTIRDKSPVHSKMAEIYELLDQPQLAALHRNRSQTD